ncbi:MAG TPA: M42 family metallopeptidase [Anaerolineae bacterium]|nr:M42 family metallopeptidase [Anaerolineae bacterium]
MSLDTLRDRLQTLLRLPGPSGRETTIADHLARLWGPLADEVRRSPLGSVHALKGGQGPDPRPKVLLAAHMDTIGLIVSHIEGEFLRVQPIGGLDPRVLPGQPVVVQGREPIPGLLVAPPDHLLPPDLRGKPVPVGHLLVDTGLPARRLRRLVQVGAPITFGTAPTSLEGDLLRGPGLDNRASVAVLTEVLEALRGRPHRWDAVFVATVQEEETLGGALTSAFAERPQVAVAVDVTFATGPGVGEDKGFPLGEGITLGWGPNIHPALHRRFKALAEALEIPHQVEYLPTHSGTDAMALQVTAEGMPSMVVSIPLRYMHTPVETVSLKDVRRAARLLAEFVLTLEAETPWLTWEE